jgi:hypothetical protein
MSLLFGQVSIAESARVASSCTKAWFATIISFLQLQCYVELAQTFWPTYNWRYNIWRRRTVLRAWWVVPAGQCMLWQQAHGDNENQGWIDFGFRIRSIKSRNRCMNQNDRYAKFGVRLPLFCARIHRTRGSRHQVRLRATSDSKLGFHVRVIFDLLFLSPPFWNDCQGASKVSYWSMF